MMQALAFRSAGVINGPVVCSIADDAMECVAK